MLRVTAEPVIAKDLKPGDLFSRYGPDYWADYPKDSAGQSVYIRTEAPAENFDQHAEVYRITIDAPIPPRSLRAELIALKDLCQNSTEVDADGLVILSHAIRWLHFKSEGKPYEPPKDPGNPWSN